jgi:hypothetical protein
MTSARQRKGEEITIRLLVALACGLFTATPALGRTIVITDEDCENIAMISPEAPRLSWAAFESSPGVFSTHAVQFIPNRAFLIRYPLDRIPKKQRITKAELVIPVNYLAGEPRLEVRRVLADWGAGVCYTYRKTSPKKFKWAKAGGRGVSTDVTLKPTAVAKLTETGPKTVNVIADVELWYTGGAVNRGWVLRLVKSDGLMAQMLSPLSPFLPGQGKWKLRITYEPR